MSENPIRSEPEEPESSSKPPFQDTNPFSPGSPELSADLEIPPELLARLVPRGREGVTGLAYSYSAWMSMSGMSPNSLQFQFGPQPTPEVLELASKTVEAEISDRKHSRLINFLGLALLVIASLVLMLVLALINENDLLLEIVKLGGVGLGGFGGGYGISALRRRN